MVRGVSSVGIALWGLCLTVMRLNITVPWVRDDSCCLTDRIAPQRRILTVLRHRFHSTTFEDWTGAD